MSDPVAPPTTTQPPDCADPVAPPTTTQPPDRADPVAPPTTTQPPDRADPVAPPTTTQPPDRVDPVAPHTTTKLHDSVKSEASDHSKNTPPAPESTTPPAPNTPSVPESTTPPVPESTTPPAPESTTPPAPELTTPKSTTSSAPELATPPPQPVFQDSWSKLSRDTVVDKIKGIIYGQAIGDALGLATEFMTQKEAVTYYGKNGPNSYSKIVQDFHRSRWAEGDWTDDTDQLLLILQMIVERNGSVEKCVFAEKMLNWRKNGFKELGDVGGMGIGMTVSQTLSHHCFLNDPHQAAKEVWERSGRYLAANGAIMRTAILGALEFNDLERVVTNTREICLVTHADPRCQASCVAVTTAIALMLQGVYDPRKKKELERLVTEAIIHGQRMLELEDQKKEIETHIRASKLKDLDLDSRSSMGYTFKALGAGFYGLQHGSDFRATLRKLIMQAGDADSNGAVYGALMGCRFGFSSLPQDLLQFQHREWLDAQVAQFLKTIGLQ